jgi:hypothetical protein
MLIFKATVSYYQQFNDRAKYNQALKALDYNGLHIAENGWMEADEEMGIYSAYGYIYVDITKHYDDSDIDLTIHGIKSLAHSIGKDIKVEAQKWLDINEWELVDCPVYWQVINDN